MPKRPTKPHETAHASHPRIYDRIGVGYAQHRRPDPRIARQLHAAVGEARTILNVGAGAGSYEPADRSVVAVEPSTEMIAQRPPGRVVRSVAEALPFGDREFEAALAILTIHHWVDPSAGLCELGRVAGRVVVFTFDPILTRDFWLVRDYLPTAVRFDDAYAPTIEMVCETLGTTRVETIPVPHDCTDGFQAAYWRRPEQYLDPQVRGGISSLARLSPEEVAPGLERLQKDLASGAWAERYADLLNRDEMDFGYRLVIRA